MDVTEHPVPACPTSTRLYQDGKVIAEDFLPGDVANLLDEHPEAVLWMDLFHPDENDLKAIAAEFKLHPLAVEDAVADHERPKLDRYPSHYFMNVYSVEVDTSGVHPEVHKAEISAFITDRALITVRKSAGDTKKFVDRWDSNAELGVGTGVGFLVYGMLDVVVDGQAEVATMIDAAMDRTEDAILEEGAAPRSVRRRGFALRKALAALRRAVAPMPEMISELTRPDSELVDDRLAPYFRDVDDHAQHATDTIDHARDRINGLLEADLTEQNNELSDITRKLAAWAAIIAVPTALTGYFGQNLPYPGYEKFWGYIQSVLLIAITAGGLYFYLKRRGWL